MTLTAALRGARRVETFAYLEDAAKLTVAAEAIGQDLPFKGRDLNDSNRLKAAIQ